VRASFENQGCCASDKLWNSTSAENTSDQEHSTASACEAEGRNFSGKPGSILVPPRWVIMDTQTKREIWLLTIGTIVVEAPLAIAAFAILAH
jgi:hypothetical protein